MAIIAPVVSRQYKSRKWYERDAATMLARGYSIQSEQVTQSRRAIGCLFGIIGYWMLPRLNVFQVTYVLTAQPPPPAVPIPSIPSPLEESDEEIIGIEQGRTPTVVEPGGEAHA